MHSSCFIRAHVSSLDETKATLTMHARHTDIEVRSSTLDVCGRNLSRPLHGHRLMMRNRISGRSSPSLTRSCANVVLPTI